MTEHVSEWDKALVLSSRQANGVAPAHPATAGLTNRSLSEMEAKANMMSKAGSDMLPKACVNNPGACLLYLDWSDRYDVAIFEVLAEVSFNRGRATVGARLQKKLAARQGYRTQKIEGDETSCTVAVYAGGQEVGRATYTYAQAEALGIIYMTEGGKRVVKSTWAGDPAQMLFHRATTRVLDHYGPSEYAALFADEFTATEPDPLDVLTSASPEVVADEVVVADTVPFDDDRTVVEREADDARASAGADTLLVGDDELQGREQHLLAVAEQAGLKAPKVSTLKQGAEIARHAGLPPVATLAQLCHPDNDQVYQAVLDWIEAK